MVVKKTKLGRGAGRTKAAEDKLHAAVYVRLTAEETEFLDELCAEHGEYRAEVVRGLLAEKRAKMGEIKHPLGAARETTNGNGYRSGT